MTYLLRVVFVFLVSTGFLFSTPSSLKSADYYSGKTLTIISPVPGGSGLDRLTRSFARYWQKHISGNPEVIVKNMPGGGFNKALNFVFERAKPDGLTVYFGPWNATALIVGSPGPRFEPKNFELVGAGGGYYVTLIRKDAGGGISDPKNITKINQFVVGGRGPAVDPDVLGNLTMQLIGAKFRFVSGYRGMSKIRPALASNEVQAANSGNTGYYAFFKENEIKQGKVIPLWYHHKFDAAGNPDSIKTFPGVKSFSDVYQEVHGKKPSGPLWNAYRWFASVPSAMSYTVFAPPGTPKDALDALRSGHASTTKDQDYIAETAKRGGASYRFLDLMKAQKNINSFRDLDPDALAALKSIMKKGQK